MHAFEYASPTTVEQAASLLADPSTPEGRGARLLAGGTDLLALMKDGVETPGRLVDLKALEALRHLEPAAGGLRLGALVRLDELAGDERVRRSAPELAAAAARVGSPQIRSQGTLGGNLCQRPRCWYFRQGFGLLAQKDGRSMVLDGDNRFHAVLGTDGPAYFVSPSTLAPLLVALGARIRLAGGEGERTLALGGFYRIPAREGELEMDLRPGEILTEVILPPPMDLAVASYEVRPGEALDWSLATASVALKLSGHIVESARVVLGQVAPVPWTAREVESFLPGQKITLETAAKAGELAVAGARPLSMNRYKVQLARVAVQRALLRAAGVEA
jgi:xanthine dehydrogenase YagS FAD-binding subunit